MTIKQLLREPRSRFLKIKCKECQQTMIIFDRATTNIYCLKCGSHLAKPTGGKAELLNAEIMQPLS